MRKATGRPRILKGKNLFISAAIATLLVQPFYLTLSSSETFAATEDIISIQEPFTTALNDVNETGPTEGEQDDNENSDEAQEDKNPEISLTTPISNSVINTKIFNIDLTATPKEGTTINRIEYKLCNIQVDRVQCDDTATIFPAGHETTTFTATIVGKVSEDGVYYITYEAFSEGENKEKYTSRVQESGRFTIDSIAPTAPEFVIILGDDGLITFTGSSADNGGTGVTLYNLDYTVTRADGSTVSFSNDVESSILNYTSLNATLNPGDLVNATVIATDLAQNDSDPSSQSARRVIVPEEEQEEQPPVTPPEYPATPEFPLGEDASPEDNEDEKDKDEDDDTTDTILGAATFSTGVLGITDPYFTEIIGGPTIPLANERERKDADSQTEGASIGDAINKSDTDERGVAEFAGIAWYWWVAMFAAVASIWSLVIAGRNRMSNDNL